MGIIKRQSIQNILFSYLGIGVGFVNATILMPLLLSPEQIGLLYFLNSLTEIIAGFATLGIPLIILKLFPSQRKSKMQEGGFSPFIGILTIVGIILGSAAYFLFRDFWISESNAARYFTYFSLSFLALFVFKVLYKNLDALIRMLYNTVLGAFLENFMVKAIVLLILLGYWLLNGYDFKVLFLLYTLVLCLPGLLTTTYIIIKGHYGLNFSAIKSTFQGKWKETAFAGLFGLLGTFGTNLVSEIDRVMIGNMMDLSHTGIYSIAFFFGIFVNVPAKAVKRVSSVILSDAWHNNDMLTIKNIYKKSSTHLFLIGTYLFLGIWLNIDSVLMILPEVYRTGKYVILFVAFGQLIDMLAGVNAEIIATSKYYRYNTYFLGGLIILVILFNLWLIPVFGITGAAATSAVAVALYNLARYILLYLVIGYQPLSMSTIKVIFIGLLSYSVVGFLVPKFDNAIVDILITGSTLTIIYWTGTYILNISDDLANLLKKLKRNS